MILERGFAGLGSVISTAADHSDWKLWRVQSQTLRSSGYNCPGRSL